MFIYLLKGLLLGFSIAAPVGPIGILCIQRTLNKGMVSGFVSGLGAATADAVYGCIAAFGVAFISDFLVSQQKLIKVLGGLFLIYLGVKTFISKPAENVAKTEEGNKLTEDYASTIGLTLTNPMTIISFSAMFAGLGIASASGEYLSAISLVIGVFTGSTLWWLLLSSSVNIFRKIIEDRKLAFINKFSGIIIFIFGIIAIKAGVW